MTQPKENGRNGVSENPRTDEARCFPWIIRQALDSYVRPMVRAKPNLRVVDVGCSGGEGIEYLTSVGVSEQNIIGIDSNVGLVKKVQSSFPFALIKKGDIADSSDDYYNADLVTCLMVSRRLATTQWEKAIKNFCQWTNEDASFLILGPHPHVSKFRPMNSIEFGYEGVEGRRDVSFVNYFKSGWEQQEGIFHRTLEQLVSPLKKNGCTFHLSELGLSQEEFLSTPVDMVYRELPVRLLLEVKKREF